MIPESNGWTAWRGEISSRIQRIEDKLDGHLKEMSDTVSTLVATQDNYVQQKDYNTKVAELEGNQKRMTKFYGLLILIMPIITTLVIWFLTRLDN